MLDKPVADSLHIVSRSLIFHLKSYIYYLKSEFLVGKQKKTFIFAFQNFKNKYQNNVFNIRNKKRHF
jgi:hypothetical protein